MSESNSEIVWYIAREGQQHGPLSDVEMRLFVQSGHLKPGDLVWNPEMTEWKPATEVFPPPPAAVTPPPPPPPPPAAKSEPEPQPEPEKVEPAANFADTSGPESKAPVAAASGLSPASTVTSPDRSQAAPGREEQTPTQAASAYRQQQPADNQTAARGQPSGPAARQPAASPERKSSVPAPEDVLPSFRPHERAAPAAAPQNAMRHQPTPVEHYEDEDDYEDEAPRIGRAGMLVGAAALVAVLAGGGFFAYQNKDTILAYMNVEAGDEASAPPVVKAEGDTKVASLETPRKAPDAPPASAPAPTGPPLQGITVTIPPTAPAQSAPSAPPPSSVSLDTIDTNLQKSQLWRVVKTEFPEWYQERVQEIAQLSGSASETDLSKHLIGKLVALRRENAKFALASSTDHLQGIAGAFLNNLKSLAGHSTAACYTFISKGETSPDVISLFPKPGYGDAIEGQIAAVFRAVADGRKTPNSREKATKPDYDVLAAELTKIGWSKADLGLFANPQALAKAPPEQVCKMVQDWFSAHVAISDKAVQERLLVETLRPVVAG
jgi:hypothetical protein